jgi:hypothetical protein
VPKKLDEVVPEFPVSDHDDCAKEHAAMSKPARIIENRFIT